MDGKEYLTYFTKDTIVCKSTEENGETVWTMKLTEEQSELVNKYFENFEANHGEETKWYSGDDMGMVSSKGFWQGFFAGAETVDETQDIHNNIILSKAVTILAILLRYRVFVINVATVYTVPTIVTIKFAKIKLNKYFTLTTNSGEILISCSNEPITGIATSKITPAIITFAANTEEK